MSYVRWSSPGHPHSYDSSVYIYDNVSGGITCCGCDLSDDSWNCATAEEMIAHVEQHIAHGDAVPDFVIPRLKAGRNFN